MKKLTYVIFSLIIFTTFCEVLYSQGHCEWLIKNLTTGSISVKIYPVSMVFNGAREISTEDLGYNLVARVRRFTHPPLRFDYINGVNYDYTNYPNHKNVIHTISANDYLCGQFDGDNAGDLDNIRFCFGAGVYKIEFWFGIDPAVNPPQDYCYVDLDAHFQHNFFEDANDLLITYIGSGISPRCWCSHQQQTIN